VRNTRSGKEVSKLIILKIILRAADITSNKLEIFKVVSLQFFTVFPVLQPLFKTVFKILNRNISQTFFTNDLMSSTSEKHFPFNTLLSFGNSKKSAGTKSGEYSRWSMVEMLVPAKNCNR
jgi:hypothetical protein